MAGVARSIELQNFMATKLKVNFFVLLRVALLLTGNLVGVKYSLNCVGTLCFRSYKSSFGHLFKLRLSSINEVVSRRCKLCKAGE